MENALYLAKPIEPLHNLVRGLDMDDRERQAFMADLQRMLDRRDAGKQVDALEDAVRQLEKSDAKQGFALLELREELIRVRVLLEERPRAKRRTPWAAIGTGLAAVGAALAAAFQYLSDLLVHR